MFFTIDVIKDSVEVFKQINKIKIYDLETKKISHEVNLTNEYYIGLFKAGYYTLIDGHIY